MSKMFKRVLLSTFICLIFSSCYKSDRNYDLDQCDRFEINNQQLSLGDTLIIQFNYEMEFISVYPGDSGHVYGVPDNTGIPVHLDEFRYQYNDTGTYTITIYNSLYNHEINSSPICITYKKIKVN